MLPTRIHQKQCKLSQASRAWVHTTGPVLVSPSPSPTAIIQGRAEPHTTKVGPPAPNPPLRTRLGSSHRLEERNTKNKMEGTSKQPDWRLVPISPSLCPRTASRRVRVLTFIFAKAAWLPAGCVGPVVPRRKTENSKSNRLADNSGIRGCACIHVQTPASATTSAFMDTASRSLQWG